MVANHDFYLVRQAEHDFDDYARFINAPGAVHLHDELIGYLMDTLAWAPTLNPATGTRGQGLCRWGPTVIDAAGASIARSIFKAWAELFACGPEELELTGDWSWIEGKSSKSGTYECLMFPRAKVVGALNQLDCYLSGVEDEDAGRYLLHLGI